jgi:hypothetical protein
MKTKDEFHKMMKDTTDIATKLQLVFEDPRDAIMSLSIILVGLSKAHDISMAKLIMLMTAIDNDMNEFTDEEHKVH